MKKSIAAIIACFVIIMDAGLLCADTNSFVEQSHIVTKIPQERIAHKFKELMQRMVLIKDPLELDIYELRELGLAIEPVLLDLINPVYAAYLISIHRTLKEQGETRKGLYGGSGADLCSYLLASNAHEGYFVDISVFDPDKFMTALAQWDEIDKSKFADRYRQDKYGWCFSTTEQDDISHDLAQKFVLELKLLGVTQPSIELEILSEIQSVYKLSFDWAYPHEDVKRREIYIMKGDITAPLSYSPTLAHLLGSEYHPAAIDLFRKDKTPVFARQYFDFYFQKAGYYIPFTYRAFMNEAIIPSLIDNGLLITDDYYRNHIYNDVFYVERSTYLDTPKHLVNVDAITQHHTSDMKLLEDILLKQDERDTEGSVRKGALGYGKILAVREISKRKSGNIRKYLKAA